MTKMTRLTHLTTLAVLCAAAPAVSAQETELIFNNYLPPYEVTQQVAIRDFAARIEAESGGTIDVVIPDVSLAPINRQYEMVLDGIADMAFVPTNEVPQVVTLNRIADLPHHAPTAEAASVALWDTYKTHFEALNEYKGLVVLSVHALPGRQFMSMKAPMASADDFAGAKIWTPPGAMSEIVEALGAVPVMVNFTNLHESVTKGMVDALVITPDSANSARVLEELHHQTTVEGGLGTISFAVVINEQRWTELTEEQRAAVLRAADGLPRLTGAAVDAREVESSSKIEQMTSVEAPDALRTAIEPILEAQVTAWLDAAGEKGLADPAAALGSYRAVLDAEATK